MLVFPLSFEPKLDLGLVGQYNMAGIAKRNQKRLPPALLFKVQVRNTLLKKPR